MAESELLNDYVSAWNRGDVAGVRSFFADSFSYADMVLCETHDADTFEAFLKRTFGNFMTLRFEVVSASVSDEVIAWEWRMKGRKRNGEKVDVPGMSMTVLTDGKITRNTDYWSKLKPPPR